MNRILAQTNVFDLPIPRKLAVILHKRNIATVEAICRYSGVELIQVPGIGHRSIEILRTLLSSCGQYLKGEEIRTLPSTYKAVIDQQMRRSA